MELKKLSEAVNDVSECAKENGINISKEGIYYLVSVLSDIVISKKYFFKDYKERLQGLKILKQLAMKKRIKIGTIELEEPLQSRIVDAIREELIHGNGNDLAFMVNWKREEKCGQFPSDLPPVNWNNVKEIEEIIKLFPEDAFKAEEELDSESKYSTKIDIPKLIRYLSFPYHLQENREEDSSKTLPKQWVVFIYDLLVMYDVKEEVATRTKKYDNIKKMCKKDIGISQKSIEHSIKSRYEDLNERISKFENRFR